MKIIKSLYMFSLGALSVANAQSKEPNFELWNKRNEPLFYAIGSTKEEVRTQPFHELRAGKWVDQRRDLRKPTVIGLAINTQPKKGDQIDIFTLKPGKDLYLRVGLPSEKEKLKEKVKIILGKKSFEQAQYIFGPQTGPLLGVKGITERGYPLKNNVTASDISKGYAIYMPHES